MVGAGCGAEGERGAVGAMAGDLITASVEGSVAMLVTLTFHPISCEMWC